MAGGATGAGGQEAGPVGVEQAAIPGPAGGYSADTLTFDRWCLELQGYEPTRCAARTDDDVAGFEQSRKRIEAFEVEHHREQRKEREFRQRFEELEQTDVKIEGGG